MLVYSWCPVLVLSSGSKHHGRVAWTRVLPHRCGVRSSDVLAAVRCACRWSVPQSVLIGINGVHEILWFGVKEGNKWLWFWPTNKTVRCLHGWNVSVSTGNGVSPSAFVECGYTLDFRLFSPSCNEFLWAPRSSYLLYWEEICVRIMSPTNT